MSAHFSSRTNPVCPAVPGKIRISQRPCPDSRFEGTSQKSCPSGLVALSGGVQFTDSTPSPKDGMVMSTLPDYTGSNPSNPPTGWLGSGSVQYTTIGGHFGGDRLDVTAVCANVCAAAAIEVVMLPSASAPNTYRTSPAPCPPGKVAIGGGAQFANGSGTADGALMLSMPIFTTGGSPTGWVAAGSTQYLGGGPGGASDHIVTYAICALVSP